MRVLITGICGFAGNSIAFALKERFETIEIIGIDNLIRAGSELNRFRLKKAGIRFYHADIRNSSDLDAIPACDIMIDAAANPTILAGIAHSFSSRRLIEHNLVGTFQLLELCKKWKCQLVLLSTSRVYSISELFKIPLKIKANQFIHISTTQQGVSPEGVDETFSTEPPLSLYGSSKRASEILALEYSAIFDFPLIINRCGILAGPGQFGKFDQGIFSYWIHSYANKKPLKFIGFQGKGYQVRDCLHIHDLIEILIKQLKPKKSSNPLIFNISGGLKNSISLAQLNQWCESRFGKHKVLSDKQKRTFDVPWLILNNKRAAQYWKWTPQKKLDAIFEEIAQHAENHSDWLDLTSE